MNVYGWLMKTELYGAYLKHRIWMWHNCSRLPILPPFCLGLHALLWSFLPLTIFILFLILIGFTVVGRNSIGTFLNAALIPSAALFFLVTAPITIRASFEHLVHFLALISATLGKHERAESLHMQAQEEYSDWVSLHV